MQADRCHSWQPSAPGAWACTRCGAELTRDADGKVSTFDAHPGIRPEQATWKAPLLTSQD